MPLLIAIVVALLAKVALPVPALLAQVALLARLPLLRLVVSGGAARRGAFLVEVLLAQIALLAAAFAVQQVIVVVVVDVVLDLFNCPVTEVEVAQVRQRALRASVRACH